MPGNAQVGEGQLPGKDHCTNMERERETNPTGPEVTRPVFELWLYHLLELCDCGQIRIAMLSLQGCCEGGREDACANTGKQYEFHNC